LRHALRAFKGRSSDESGNTGRMHLDVVDLRLLQQ
jgi:hypothetical protein